MLSDNKTLPLPFPASVAVARYDLMYWDTAVKRAKPLTSLATGASEALDQATVSANFLGASLDQRLSTETDDAAMRTVATEGVFDYDCPSFTPQLGNMVGVTWNGGAALVNQVVKQVTQLNLAIGLVVGVSTQSASNPWATPTTRIRVRLLSRVCWDLAHNARSLFDGQGTGSTALADANQTLTVGSNPFLSMIPTAARTITLPAAASSAGFAYLIANNSTTGQIITVQDAGANAIAVLTQGQRALVWCDGTTWLGLGAGSITPLTVPAVSKTADYVLLAADQGTFFDNTGAAGSVNFTLPAVATSKGYTAFFYGVVDQPIVITAPAGTLVGPNNAGRTTYTSAGAGNRIGQAIEAYCNGSKWFLFVDVKGLTLGTFA